jgi:glycosyltransferase involved in cell wall biosynthesis
MKIVQFIARVNRGGTANWLDNLIPGLRNAGHEVLLIAGEVESNEVEDPCFRELDGVRFFGLSRSLSPIRDVQAIINMRRILKEFNPDILNTHTAKAGFIGRLASLGLPIKKVHTFHGHLLYGYFGSWQTSLYILIERILFPLTDKFISVGDQVMQDLLKAKIGSKDKYLVINPGVASLKFQTRKGAIDSIKLKPSNYGVSVGWLGRITQIKRPDRLLQIANALPNIRFLAGGEGELLQELKSVAPRNLEFIGWVEPEIFWPICDIAILTSDNEGLPTSLIEASQAGLPIIALNVGSVKEIVSDNYSGILVDDLGSLVDSIQILSMNSDLRTEFGRMAQRISEDKFGITLFIQSHLKLYSGLIR